MYAMPMTGTLTYSFANQREAEEAFDQEWERAERLAIYARELEENLPQHLTENIKALRDSYGVSDDDLYGPDYDE